jgi:divalent metal cation (Fe/Co/Zn/Cd) transporter
MTLILHCEFTWEGKMSKDVFLRQHKLAVLLVLWRIPGVITSFLAAIASNSMIVWMEFVENVSIVAPGILLLIISAKLMKNLKFMFNYGIGKIEAITALTCEIFDLAGLGCVLLFAVRKLIYPGGERNLELALIISAVGLLIDLFILYREKLLTEKDHSRIVHTAFLSAKKEFVFDFITIFTLIIGIIFHNTRWIVYFSPIVCIILIVPFSLEIGHHLSSAVQELIDLTLDEESQLLIIKVLNEFYDSYELLGDIKSRVNGNYKNIDISLQFNPDMTYKEIRDVSTKIKKRIDEEIGNCNVNINII